MMEKKRSIGIRIVGGSEILYGLFLISYVVFMYVNSLSFPETRAFGFAIISGLFLIPIAVFTIITAILVFKLKEKGRVFSIIPCPILVFFSARAVILSHLDIESSFGYWAVNAPLVLILGLVIYFFTRPKVKEQFK